jgi:hypothetical protein
MKSGSPMSKIRRMHAFGISVVVGLTFDVSNFNNNLNFELSNMKYQSSISEYIECVNASEFDSTSIIFI